MGAKAVKLITVPANGQISIGSSWAGRQIRIEELNDSEIHISSGMFVPDSQKTFYTKDATQALSEFNSWEKDKPAKATDTKALFASLKRKSKVVANKTKSTQHDFVECDLEWPRVQRELENLELPELEQVEKTVEKVQQMTWDQIYKTSSKTQKRGLNWEPIADQKTGSGKAIASIRISNKFRARVCRDGKIMRFISLHPDHDSAYDESGGEKI